MYKSIVSLAALTFTMAGCLPKDSRPPPAEVYVQASADDAIKNGFTTDDGWRVEFSRFLVTLGRVSISGDSCNPYSEGNYQRILDMQQPSPQKVALLYGLGTCDFSFGLVHPVSDSVIGPGVTADEALSMRTAGNDLYTSFAGQLTGINTLVIGKATKGNETKSFNWPFRLDYYFQGCTPYVDAGAPGLDLHGNDSVTIDFMAVAKTLFNALAEPLIVASGPTQFDIFAKADSIYGNNDGQVSLDELALVPLTDLANVSPPIVACLGGVHCPWPDAGVEAFDASIMHAPSLPPRTLGDYVYYYLFPMLIRYEDVGTCAATTVRPRRD